MSKESLVILFGLIVLFMPWLGLPSIWKQYVYTAIGILLFLIGFLLRKAAYLRRIDKGNGEFESDSFVESEPDIIDSEDENPLV